MSTAPVIDVLVIGGGAAGLAAASVLAAARRRVVVVDEGQPRNAVAAHVRGFLSHEGCSPADVIKGGRAEVEAYGGDVRPGAVRSVDLLGDDGDSLARVRAVVEPGPDVLARRLVLATGIVDERPEIPGFDEAWGSGVYVCPFCHGWDVRDQRLGVLATEQDAPHLALMLTMWSGDVTLLLHERAGLDEEDAARLAARDVAVRAGTVVALHADEDRLRAAELADGSTVALDALFLAPRCATTGTLVEDLGCAVREDGSVEVDGLGRTSVEHVYAAGNVVDLAATVLVAASTGAGAAVAICADLVEEDTERAVRRSRGRGRLPV